MIIIIKELNLITRVIHEEHFKESKRRSNQNDVKQSKKICLFILRWKEICITKQKIDIVCEWNLQIREWKPRRKHNRRVPQMTHGNVKIDVYCREKMKVIQIETNEPI